MVEIAQGPAHTFATPSTDDTSMNSTGLETRHSAPTPKQSKESNSAMPMWEVLENMDQEQEAKISREAEVALGP